MAEDLESLEVLTERLIELQRVSGRTPVLVLPRRTWLAPQLLEKLSTCIARRTGASVRIDWCHDPNSFAARIELSWRRYLCRRYSRRLAAVAKSQMSVTYTISRPPSSDVEFVMGLCDDQVTLPEWSTPIRVC